MDYRDLVIEQLARDEADLHETNRALIDALADVTLENVVLRQRYEYEHLARVHGDAMIRRLQRRLNRKAADSFLSAA